MAGTIEKLQTINSLIRTVLALTVFGGVGAAGWYGYTTYNAVEIESQRKDAALQATEQELTETKHQVQMQKDELDRQTAQIAQQKTEIDNLNREVQRQKLEIERLDTALRLHKLERRLAQIRVLETGVDEASGRKFSKIEFQELNDQGDPVGEPKQVDVQGETVYVDYWVVKFEDKYVEQADLQRGMSICMFNRIFGDQETPNDGDTLDQPGQRPGSYAQGGVLSDFEKKIWADFWSIANDPSRAAELGIRTIHGDAVSIKVEKGKTYRIIVRSSGGPEIKAAAPPSEGSLPRRGLSRPSTVLVAADLNITRGAEPLKDRARRRALSQPNR